MSKLIAIFLSIIFSFLMFVGMNYLIEPDQMTIVEEEPQQQPTITFEVEDDPPTVRHWLKPMTKPKPKPRPVVTSAQAEESTHDFTLFKRVALADHIGIDIKGIGINTGQNQDGDARPQVTINPAYPPAAASKGIEGYVTLSFDISELGRPFNIKVVDANPKRMFERNARRALSKWKYAPKMENNSPVIQTNQRVTLEFKLESELL